MPKYKKGDKVYWEDTWGKKYPGKIVSVSLGNWLYNRYFVKINGKKHPIETTDFELKERK